MVVTKVGLVLVSLSVCTLIAMSLMSMGTHCGVPD